MFYVKFVVFFKFNSWAVKIGVNVAAWRNFHRFLKAKIKWFYFVFFYQIMYISFIFLVIWCQTKLWNFNNFLWMIVTFLFQFSNTSGSPHIVNTTELVAQFNQFSNFLMGYIEKTTSTDLGNYTLPKFLNMQYWIDASEMLNSIISDPARLMQ